MNSKELEIIAAAMIMRKTILPNIVLRRYEKDVIRKKILTLEIYR